MELDLQIHIINSADAAAVRLPFLAFHSPAGAFADGLKLSFSDEISAQSQRLATLPLHFFILYY